MPSLRKSRMGTQVTMSVAKRFQNTPIYTLKEATVMVDLQGESASTEWSRREQKEIDGKPAVDSRADDRTNEKLLKSSDEDTINFRVWKEIYFQFTFVSLKKTGF